MANEQQEILNQEIAKLEEETRKLAAKMQELVGIDCTSGSCVFDPAMENVEKKLEEVRKRAQTLESIKKALRECGGEV
ncbi:MAG: hypothetical protein PHO53_00300 [Actinomycetota bacterium]|nr:hypothetical protein [Actinomycetota bacterium]